ncbi:MAG TPA: response regulator, partial [Tepidiformaceae bacterium]|nr:response regulator [Tepidiformaceae bacterium]
MARVPQLIVVDPDRESSAELAKTLQALGFQVLATAGYGVEAFTLCFQLRPDLVLMRVEEPLVRPIQTLSRINDGLPDLPIVAFSTEANIRLMRQSMVGGASDYLVEPINTDELEQSIMRVLEKKEREGMRRRGELALGVGRHRQPDDVVLHMRRHQHLADQLLPLHDLGAVHHLVRDRIV